MAFPGMSVQVLLHSYICRKVCPSDVNRAISCTGEGVTKVDWVAAEWNLVFIDVVLAVT